MIELLVQLQGVEVSVIELYIVHVHVHVHVIDEFTQVSGILRSISNYFVLNMRFTVIEKIF